MGNIFENVVKDIENVVEDVENVVKDVENVVKDIENVVEDVENENVADDPSPVENEEFFVVIKDEVIQGLCNSKSRALEYINELAERDMETATITNIYRREYDEVKMTLKIYAQSWTMAIFPFERIEHYYFVTPVERID